FIAKALHLKAIISPNPRLKSWAMIIAVRGIADRSFAGHAGRFDEGWYRAHDFSPADRTYLSVGVLLKQLCDRRSNYPVTPGQVSCAFLCSSLRPGANCIPLKTLIPDQSPKNNKYHEC